ncbi:hypothetical protein P885DRAFT_63362 [Corynascus similis CBS 632.67]
MAAADPDSPPRPCDYFDMISGASTGALIAIMPCYRVHIKGKFKEVFSAAKLEQVVKQILVSHGLGENVLTLLIRCLSVAQVKRSTTRCDKPATALHEVTSLIYEDLASMLRDIRPTSFFKSIAIVPFGELIDGVLLRTTWASYTRIRAA